MKWTIASHSDLDSLIDFILIKEWNHTFFTTKLIKKGKFTLPSKSKIPILLLKGKNYIKAACMVTVWGALFPIFREKDVPDASELKELTIWINKN